MGDTETNFKKIKMVKEASFEDFLKVDIRIGTVIEVSDFPKAKKPAYKLQIDFGDLGIKKSSAQITDLYTKNELLNKQVSAIVNFKPRQIANFMSECLVLGVYNQNDNVVLLQASKKIKKGELISNAPIAFFSKKYNTKIITNTIFFIIF